MIIWESAKRIIEKAYPDSIVNSIMEIPMGYVINIQPKDWKDGEVILDGFFKIDKITGVLTEYSPVMDTKEFKYALNHPVYIRKSMRST